MLTDISDIISTIDIATDKPSLSDKQNRNQSNDINCQNFNEKEEKINGFFDNNRLSNQLIRSCTTYN